MNEDFSWRKFFGRVLSYVMVAVFTAVIMFCALGGGGYTKLDQLEGILEERFIGEVDKAALEDAAAAAMVDALGDRWSYYISAEDYAAYRENKKNSYVGVGITISKQEGGFLINAVTEDGPAQKAGILPEDVLVAVDGENVRTLTVNEVKDLVQGESGTQVKLTVSRSGKEHSFSVTRQAIQKEVATAQLLDGNVGLVTIANFNDHCADETHAAVGQLLEQGAQSLIFDVRNNGGGYLHEMVNVLNYLLPEGTLVQRVDYYGKEEKDVSDANCLEMPMAVLINGSSYSAAELFAAALWEYDWAVLVGENTSGKGYYQNTVGLKDGSAVNLSVGKYLTPKGVNLQEQGGLTPDVLVEVDADMAAKIKAGIVPPAEDPQIQAAIQALGEKKP